MGKRIGGLTNCRATDGATLIICIPATSWCVAEISNKPVLICSYKLGVPEVAIEHKSLINNSILIFYKPFLI